jgi:hypothetical protein
MNRRKFAKQFGAILTVAGMTRKLRAGDAQASSAPPGKPAAMPHAMPSGPPLQIAMLVYPGMTVQSHPDGLPLPVNSVSRR